MTNHNPTSGPADAGAASTADAGATTYEITVTDTFNGEANYSWVHKYTINVPQTLSTYALVRRVKRLIGWSGRRTQTINYYGEHIELRPYGACVVCFIA